MVAVPPFAGGIVIVGGVTRDIVGAETFADAVSPSPFDTEDFLPAKAGISEKRLPSKNCRVAALAFKRLIESALTDKQRLVVRSFLSGYSTDGIAEQTGTNRNAVYKLLHDARVKLKTGFAEAGFSADDVTMALA